MFCDMGGMFHVADYFNGDISQWDVTKVTNMSDMLDNYVSFNSVISQLDVSKVTNMSDMFDTAV